MAHTIRLPMPSSSLRVDGAATLVTRIIVSIGGGCVAFVRGHLGGGRIGFDQVWTGHTRGGGVVRS